MQPCPYAVSLDTEAINIGMHMLAGGKYTDKLRTKNNNNVVRPIRS